MADIHSTFTDLPLSCKSAADRMAREIAREERFADLSEASCRELTKLEETLSRKTGEKVALVAYRI